MPLLLVVLVLLASCAPDVACAESDDCPPAHACVVGAAGARCEPLAEARGAATSRASMAFVAVDARGGRFRLVPVDTRRSP